MVLLLWIGLFYWTSQYQSIMSVDRAQQASDMHLLSSEMKQQSFDHLKAPGLPVKNHFANCHTPTMPLVNLPADPKRHCRMSKRKPQNAFKIQNKDNCRLPWSSSPTLWTSEGFKSAKGVDIIWAACWSSEIILLLSRPPAPTGRDGPNQHCRQTMTLEAGRIGMLV